MKKIVTGIEEMGMGLEEWKNGFGGVGERLSICPVR